MLRCLNKKQNDKKQYPVQKFSEICLGKQYPVQNFGEIFCCTVPGAFTEDEEGPDVLYKDGLNTGNKH